MKLIAAIRLTVLLTVMVDAGLYAYAVRERTRPNSGCLFCDSGLAARFEQQVLFERRVITVAALFANSGGLAYVWGALIRSRRDRERAAPTSQSRPLEHWIPDY